MQQSTEKSQPNEYIAFQFNKANIYLRPYGKYFREFKYKIPGIHNARQTDKNTILEVIVLQLHKYLVIRKMSQYP